MAHLKTCLLHDHQQEEAHHGEPCGDDQVGIAEDGDVASGLVLHGRLFEGCSGCVVEQRRKEGRLPAKELSLVALLILSSALPISSLYPFVYFMVQDLGIASSDTDIGFYAGLIGSALMLGRFVASTPWGLITDKCGRKPAIVFSSISRIVFNTTFGFSTTYWMAVVSRLLLGILNGLLVSMRAYISEICSENQQSFGMSLIGTVWGVGLIIGPALGGGLAQPAIQYPYLFPEGSLFDRFPYALPCICISGVAVVSLILTFWIPETFHKHPVSHEIGTYMSDSKKCSDISKPVAVKEPFFKNCGLMSAIFLSCMWSIHDMAYTELFSLWAESPRAYGGLGMTTSDVGIILAITGGVLLIFQLAFYPWLQNRLGPINMSCICSVLSIPLTTIYPLFARLDGALLWGLLTAASILKNILSVSVSTASFILINNSVTIDQRGLANGISMSLMSLGRAVGPSCAGYLLSWA